MRNIDNELHDLICEHIASRRQFGEMDHIIFQEITDFVQTVMTDYMEDSDNDL